MSMSIEDLPTIENAGRLGRRVHAGSAVGDAYRTPSTSGADLTGSLGISAALRFVDRMRAGLSPSADQLSALQAAQGPSYTQYFDCGPYNYNGTCNEACFGFAPHHMDPFYCATCAEQAADPANNPAYNWHFVGTRGQIRYMDREPDVCDGKDAWKWKVGACGNCAESAVFRCHDGWKLYTDGTMDPTICQGLVECDDRLTTC